MSHITGGGFYENIPRALPENLGAEIKTETIQIPKILSWLIETANLDINEAYNVFNMGIGFIMIVDEEDVEETLSLFREVRYDASLFVTYTYLYRLIFNI